MHHRRSPARALLVALLVSLVAACSSGGSESGGGGGLTLGGGGDEATTSTTTVAEAAEERNLQLYLTGLRTRSTTTQGASYGSPAGDYGTFLASLPPESASLEGAGPDYRLCGPGQPAECSTLTDFEYDGASQVTDFSMDGVPVSDRLRGDGIGTRYATGSTASLGLQWAYLGPDGVLYVVEQYWWNDEVLPDTNGCVPAEATYSRGGAVMDPQGGGKGSNPLGPWLMVMRFGDASLGGELKVPCYRTDGSSEVFTQPVPT